MYHALKHFPLSIKYFFSHVRNILRRKESFIRLLMFDVAEYTAANSFITVPKLNDAYCSSTFFC